MGCSWNITNDSNIEQIARHVSRLIDIQDAELGEEFFPAHSSVALIDAILTPQLRYYQQVVPIIERYCTRFKLQRVRADRAQILPVTEQETLSDLIGHYETMGTNGFQDEIIQARYVSPGTRVLKSETIRRAAIKLRDIEIETLQDIQSKNANEIKCVLRPIHGIGDRTIHMFLMYVGRDDYVKGDVHVVRFVKQALNEHRISAVEAESLVQEAARKLGIAPRLLDYEIWKYQSGSNVIGSNI